MYGFHDSRWYGSDRFRNGLWYSWLLTENGWLVLTRFRPTDTPKRDDVKRRPLQHPSTYG